MRVNLQLAACFAAISLAVFGMGQSVVKPETVRKTDAEKTANPGRMAALQDQLQKQTDAKQWDAALKTIEQMDGCSACKSLWRLRIYATAGDVTNYSSTAQTILQGKFKDDPIVLNEIAQHIVGSLETLRPRNLDLALQTAEKAVSLTKRKNAEDLDTLAWTYHWLGQDDRATRVEREALSHSAPDEKDYFRSVLHKNFN